MNKGDWDHCKLTEQDIKDRFNSWISSPLDPRLSAPVTQVLLDNWFGKVAVPSEFAVTNWVVVSSPRYTA